MSINVKKSEKSDTKAENYPILLEATISDLVILATQETESYVVGTVVVTGGIYDVGYYSQAWSIDSFAPYTGTITLEND